MSNFFKTTTKLFFSKTAASLIVLLAFPALSRLYDPQQFGLYALYASFVMLLTPVACLRCEMAMIVEKEDSTARTLFLACFGVIAVITVILWLTLQHIIPTQYIFSDGNKILPILIAVNFALEGCNIAMLSFATRVNLLDYVIASDLTKAIVMVSYQIAAAMYFQASSVHLIYGYFFASLASFLVCSPIIYKALNLTNKKRISFKKLVHEKKSFLIYGSVGSLFNGLAVHTPTIIIGSLFGKETLGLINAATRLLSLPSKTMGAAVSRSFFAKTNFSVSGPSFVKNTELAICYLMYSLAPLIILAPSSETLFNFLLGKDWGGVGRYYSLLLFFYVGWTLTSPLSSIFSTTDKQNKLLQFQLAKFVVRVSTLVVGSTLFSVDVTLVIYAVFSGIAQFAQTDEAYSLAGGERLRFYYLITRGLLPATILSVLLYIFSVHFNPIILVLFTIGSCAFCTANIYYAIISINAK